MTAVCRVVNVVNQTVKSRKKKDVDEGYSESRRLCSSS